MNKVTIVMYHYVRDLANSRFPQIRGLDYSLFKKQIEFFKPKLSGCNHGRGNCSMERKL